MSSKIELQRICQYCEAEFTARTTVTRYCSHKCASAAHKQKVRVLKIELSNKETQQIKNRPIEDLKAKEFLTVREVARLLNCSVRSIYYYIDNGTIKAVNLGQRSTRVKRSDIDRLFDQQQPLAAVYDESQIKLSECYTLTEVQEKFGISRTTLQNLVNRNKIPKIKEGKFAYIPKTDIENLLA